MKLAAVLAAVGVVLAAYLTWTHYNAGALVCTLGDCHTVQSSEYAMVGPLPVALLGLGMYLTVLACNLTAMTRPDLGLAATSVAFAATLGGIVYAAYLTWLEVAVIGAICQWCVVSALLTILLVALEGILVWQALALPETEDPETERAGAAYVESGPSEKGTSGSGQGKPAGGNIAT